jgi:hypothetical protein
LLYEQTSSLLYNLTTVNSINALHWTGSSLNDILIAEYGINYYNNTCLLNTLAPLNVTVDQLATIVELNTRTVGNYTYNSMYTEMARPVTTDLAQLRYEMIHDYWTRNAATYKQGDDVLYRTTDGWEIHRNSGWVDAQGGGATHITHVWTLSDEFWKTDLNCNEFRKVL